MFSVVSVKCSDWVFIRESSVSTVSTKCEIAILQCQHTNFIWAVFVFIGKDIQVFLVFRISAFCSWTCWTGIINRQEWWSLHSEHFCWILNCQNDDVSDYCVDRWNHWRKELMLPVQKLEVPRLRQESLLNNNIIFLETEGFVVGTWTIPQILTLKHKLAALRRAFCMFKRN